MIDYLKGTCVAKYGSTAVININGIGYGVEVPERFFQKTIVGDEVEAWVYTKVREDALSLYGFSSLIEKQVFQVLVGISGVGPKVGVGMMNTLSIDAILSAVTMEDAKIFETCPGIGKRLSEKILIELKPKLEKLRDITGSNPVLGGSMQPVDLGLELTPTNKQSYDPALFSAAESALINLGFQSASVKKEIIIALSEDSALDEQGLIRKCLLALNKSPLQKDHRHLF